MSYKIDKTILVDGPLTQVDDTARYPLGFEVTDENGKEYVYVKATAALTAGTAVAGLPVHRHDPDCYSCSASNSVSEGHQRHDRKGDLHRSQ